MNFPRDELWFRKVYENLVEKGEITTIFRPGDRICGDLRKKCFVPGETLTLRVLEKPGDGDRKIKPVFSHTVREVRVTNMDVVNIDELKEEDFEGSYPNVHTSEDLSYHLGLIYNKNPDSFDKVTKIQIEYLI